MTPSARSSATQFRRKLGSAPGASEPAAAPPPPAQVICPFPSEAAAAAAPAPPPAPVVVIAPSKIEGETLLNCLGDLVFKVRRDGLVLDMRCAEDHELALSPEGIVGKGLVELLPTQIALQAKHHMEKVLRTGELKVVTCPYALPGRAREFQVRLVPAGPDEVLAVLRDVTDRRIFEKEILDVSHRAQLRIGQDLHDGLGQHLTGITFLSKALENKLTARGLPEAAEAAEIARLVIQALAQTRNLARGLFPVELESGGLVPALKELANTMKSLFNMACSVECDPNLVIRRRDAANHLFRLAQEAVNNSVKHGHAQRVEIKLSRTPENTILTVTDDGAGFDAEEKKWSGLGMRIMQYRAKKIGARLEFHSASLGGTEMVCTIGNVAVEEEDPGDTGTT